MWTLEPEIRWRYVEGMTRLSVWYVRLLLERSDISKAEIPKALCRRVNLYRLTTLWDGVRDGADGMEDPRWMQLVAEITPWFGETAFVEVSSLEDRVLARLRPLLEERVPKDVGPAPVRPFVCWTYELGWAGLASRPGLLGKLTNAAHLGAVLRRRLHLAEAPSRNGVLHFMNVLVPRSPLDDLGSLAVTLRALIADVRRQHPQVGELWCNTWLNDHPRFLKLFPEAWARSGVVSPPGNFRNWWGQFARRDGDFNETAAQQFRHAGGVFPYRALGCHASLDAIDRHLAEHFGKSTARP